MFGAQDRAAGAAAAGMAAASNAATKAAKTAKYGQEDPATSGEYGNHPGVWREKKVLIVALKMIHVRST